MATTMAAQKTGKAGSDVSADVERKIRKLQELYADAPEVGRAALESGLPALKQELGAGSRVGKAGRIGLRQGKVSEFTLIVPFEKGGAKRLRGFLEALGGNFQLADLVGTVHDMRFVFLDNDTKLLFATAYDGDFDPYIDDFATKIPNGLDLLFANTSGWPGIRSPKIKDWIVEHEVESSAWYVSNPDLTVAETRKLERIGKAVEEVLDKVQ